MDATSIQQDRPQEHSPDRHANPNRSAGDTPNVNTNAVARALGDPVASPKIMESGESEAVESDADEIPLAEQILIVQRVASLPVCQSAFFCWGALFSLLRGEVQTGCACVYALMLAFFPLSYDCAPPGER